jgi:hypothetical protein
MLLGAPDARGAQRRASRMQRRRNAAPPPMLAVVRDVQRGSPPIWASRSGTGTDGWAETVRRIGLALRAEDPMMRGDRVHFTSAGADWIGGVLSERPDGRL